MKDLNLSDLSCLWSNTNLTSYGVGIETLGGEPPKSILPKSEETVPTGVHRFKVCMLLPDVPSLQTGTISLLNAHFLLGSK